MATDPQRMANGAMVFFPPQGANVIQAGQIIPGTIIQAGGAVQHAGQPLSSPQQNPQAIQIMIGVVHIGFGAVPLAIWNYSPLAGLGGYPFWGGLFFIASGSLSVSVENHPSKCVVRCCMGMNITSAVMALIGVILYIAEISVNVNPYYGTNHPAGVGISVLLLFFSLLEFCITVSTAHFGCQATCCHSDTPVFFVPYTISRGAACAEGHPGPPAYEDPSWK